MLWYASSAHVAGSYTIFQFIDLWDCRTSRNLWLSSCVRIISRDTLLISRQCRLSALLVLQWCFEFSLNEIFLLFIEMCPLVGIIIGIALFYISIISELKCTEDFMNEYWHITHYITNRTKSHKLYTFRRFSLLYFCQGSNQKEN